MKATPDVQRGSFASTPFAAREQRLTMVPRGTCAIPRAKGSPPFRQLPDVDPPNSRASSCAITLKC